MLAAGSRLGPYEILSPIGAGGMGEVYKAKDTRLERIVAVKVLPQHLSSSPEIRQRFEREAKTVSQFSHSHICALYDVGREGETEYLVMEYLEGETLSERLARGSLPLEQTLRFGTEIADALDKAHRQGIVHRDLKPGNVMITKSGVKLLDFGLAKAMSQPVQQSGATSLPTVMGTGQNLTQEGTILGTFQYMAPEQLEGKEADARTDIFAFGCLLYEMATGRKAFSGSSQASLISAIMKEDPAPISTIQPMAPAALDRVVRKSLAKDPEDRWQNAADLGSELRWISEGGSQTGIAAPAVAGRRRRAWLPWAAAVLLAAAGFGLGRVLAPERPGPVLRSSIDLPAKMDLDPQNTSLALSPEGSRLAFAAKGPDGRSRLWVRAMDSLEVQPLSGTEDAMQPFWSPDSRFLGFFADHKLKKVPASGGAVQAICEAADGRGATWGSKDTIVFAPSPFSGLSQVSASGGSPTILTESRELGSSHRLPFFLPDGRHVLFLAGTARAVDKDNAICVLDLESKKISVLAHENSEGRYAEPGYLLFVREGNVMAQPMDASSLRLSGAAVPVAERVYFNPVRWTGDFSFSRSGLLLFRSGTATRKYRLTWFDLDGKPLGTVGQPASIRQVRLSPDGSRAMAMILAADGATGELWMYDLARGVATRFTSSGYSPAWSPDGRRVAYADGDGNVWVKTVDGTSEPKKVHAATTASWPLSWSPDGRLIAFRFQDPKSGGFDIWLAPADGSEKSKPLLATAAQETWCAFSPDGRWLAYISDESGQGELYVVPFPVSGEKRQISSGGADFAYWLGDGRRIAYRQPPENKIVATDLGPRGGALSIGETHSVLGGKAFPQAWADASRDGKRMLFPVPLEEDQTRGLTLVTNWSAELKRK
jgi:Tol biopolymer transport system component